MKYNEIDGDLVQLGKEWAFDVIAHGCNCMCKQRSGLAPQMVAAFNTDLFTLEKIIYRGDINKLGQIDYSSISTGDKTLWIVNCYTQFKPATEDNPNPLDYDALRLCMRKINYKFKGKHIGLPTIGAGLAGGSWEKISNIIQEELTDVDVTIVFKK